MILEEEINKVINKYSYNLCSIEKWGLIDKYLKAPYSIKYSNHPYLDIDSLIKNAPLIICLTSPSRYIREVKKWFEVHKNDT